MISTSRPSFCARYSRSSFASAVSVSGVAVGWTAMTSFAAAGAAPGPGAHAASRSVRMTSRETLRVRGMHFSYLSAWARKGGARVLGEPKIFRPGRSTIVSSPAIEEYLQVIYTLADESTSVIAARIAEFLGVSAPAVSEMLHRLEREGLVTISDRHEVRLTPAGQTAANTVVRRHRLIERFLVDILGYEWWKVHDEAERLEHALSPEMEERMARVLGDPSTCPHARIAPARAGVRHRADPRPVRARARLPGIPRERRTAAGRERDARQPDRPRAPRVGRRRPARGARRLRAEGVGARLMGTIYV